MNYGNNAGMETMRKITVEVPEKLLDMAQSETGKGVSDTVRDGLRKLASARAQKELLALRGKVKFSISYEDMKEDRS
jgi:Arc/MetJ-type ribon-helix-helix transcriptional regulator